MPSDLIRERINGFNREYRDFVTSDFVDISAIRASARYQWTRDQQEVYENSLILYLLFFINRFELVEMLITDCDLSISQAYREVNSIRSKLPPEMNVVMDLFIVQTYEKEDDGVQTPDRFNFLSKSSKKTLWRYWYAKYEYGRNVANRYQIPDSNREEFYTVLGDIILGFYRIEDTIPLLEQELGIDHTTATALGGEVLEFLRPLSDPNWQPPADFMDAEYEDEVSEQTAVQTIAEPTPSALRIPIKSSPLPGAVPTPYAAPAGVANAPTPIATPAEPTYVPTTIVPAPQNRPVTLGGEQASRTPLSSLPSYTPTPTPPPVPPVPDKPRWSTDY